MSVHQTRLFFKERDGYIVQNPQVGPTLSKAYWECGNSRAFLDIVQELTGKELTGASWVDALQEQIEVKVKRERKEYDQALAKDNNNKAATSDLDKTLNMTIKFVDGDTLIADSSKLPGGILDACEAFEKFVVAR